MDIHIYYSLRFHLFDHVWEVQLFKNNSLIMMFVLLFLILLPQIQILNLNVNIHMIKKKGYIENKKLKGALTFLT